MGRVRVREGEAEDVWVGRVAPGPNPFCAVGAIESHGGGMVFRFCLFWKLHERVHTIQNRLASIAALEGVGEGNASS